MGAGVGLGAMRLGADPVLLGPEVSGPLVRGTGLASLTLTTIAEDSIVEDWQAAQPDADSRGEIRLDGLVRGQHTALVSAPGHVSLWLKWGIPTPPRLEAAMLRALSIEGVVLGPDGASCTGRSSRSTGTWRAGRRPSIESPRSG